MVVPARVYVMCALSRVLLWASYRAKCECVCVYTLHTVRRCEDKAESEFAKFIRAGNVTRANVRCREWNDVYLRIKVLWFWSIFVRFNIYLFYHKV